VPNQLVTIRAEGVGQDSTCARFDVFAVHFGDYSRVGQVEFVEALVEIHPAAVKDGSHRAVSKQGDIAG